MTRLTTHILDLTHGTPANNVTIKLYYKENETNEWNHLKTTVTNQDGRLDHPLLSEDEVKIGSYELVFHIGTYFRVKKLDLSDPPFLEEIPVRFQIANTTIHYHVPLLISPWGYQVYRGS
jgi:5-hydroxyisourate hydrolase